MRVNIILLLLFPIQLLFSQEVKPGLKERPQNNVVGINKNNQSVISSEQVTLSSKSNEDSTNSELLPKYDSIVLKPEIINQPLEKANENYRDIIKRKNDTSGKIKNEENKDSSKFLWFLLPFGIAIGYLLNKSLMGKKKKNVNKPKDLEVGETYTWCDETGKYFYSEIMLSAGPRKVLSENETDTELGEDVIGCITKKDRIFFWVMDGTSGQAILKEENQELDFFKGSKVEYFSSRLLAQEIARNIQAVVRGQNFSMDSKSKKIIKKAIDLTKEQWNSRIDSLSNEDRKSLKDLLIRKNQLICSTTIAFGMLDIKGNLDAIIFGDSILLTLPQKEIPNNNRRFSANLLNKENDISLDFNELDACIQINQNDVKQIVLMSDGINLNVVKWLQNKDIELNDKVVQAALLQKSQNTKDDKSFCLIKIESD